MEDRSYPRSWIWLDFLIPAFILAVATILFRIFPWDMQIEQHFYQPGSGWFLRDHTIWNLLYHYGNIPALLMVLAAIYVLASGFQKPNLTPFRKITVYYIILMIVGPGLFINTFLKDHWGRPRPRDMVEFGGNSQYEKVLTVDTASTGKSFPSGHASMGFYLFAPFVIFRRNHPRFAPLFLILGIVMGCLMGMARIVQGGHFASDVIWSGGLVYLSSAFVFYIMNLHKYLFYEPKEEQTAEKVKWLQVGVLFLSLLLILAVIFATPYEKDKSFVGIPKYIEKSRDGQIQMNVPQADVKIRTGDWFNFNINASGFAFPGSALKNQLFEFLKDTTYQATYIQKKKGIFSELNQNIDITLPSNLPLEYWLTLDKGMLDMTVNSAIASQKWTLLVNKGNCVIHVKQGQLVHIYAETRGKKIDKQYGYTLTPNPASQIPMIDMKIYLKDGDLFLP